MNTRQNEKNSGIVDTIGNLNDDVKALAINLAIYLAKAKSKSEKIDSLEPEFIKLVNGTIKVVQEVTQIINAAKHKETLVYDVPSGNLTSDHLELKLNSILDQCRIIMENLTGLTDLKA